MDSKEENSVPQAAPEAVVETTVPTVVETTVVETTVVNEASPADKQAEAEKKASVVIDSLPSLKQDASIPNDQNTNDSSVIAQAIVNANEAPVKQTEEPVKKAEEPTKKTPGSFKDAKVGWNAFSALPNPGDEKAIEGLNNALGLESVISMYSGARTSKIDENDLVSKYLSESYYGEWYHNGAVMLFTVFFTWLLTRFGGGFFASIVIGAFLATYYQTSIRRLRRNVRDDIQRELATNRLETETESADWINHFMSRFWLIYEPVLSAQIIGIADAILVDSTPSFLDSIRLSTFTLGTKAPRVESIKTITKTEPNVVCMDWKFSFVPNDTYDLTERDKQSKVNPKIVLTIRLGKGIIGADMPILVEDLAFSGHLRLKFRMFNEFPHIKTVEASFLEKPTFDYSLKPVGGETFGFDINNIPGLESFIREQVHATLDPMMYAPNVYTLDVAGMMSGAADLTSAYGVLIVKIHSATGLKDLDLFGTLDPYITLHVGNGNNAEVGRTKHIEDSRNPKFDETLFILLNNPNDVLVLQVMDRNTGRTDSTIGTCTFDMKTLADSDNLVEALSLPVLNKGKTFGEVKCDFHYFPVNSANKSEDGVYIPPEESNSGILRFTVHECKELGGQQKSGGLKIPIIGKSDLSPYAVVKFNDVERLRTNPFKRSINPRWDKQVEIFVADKTQLNLRVDVFDDSFDDRLLGRWQSTLEALQDDIFIKQQDWWNLKDGSGKIHLSMQWKPITMTGFTDGLSHGGYRPPIGVVRIHCVGANDLKNVEAMTGGKSDPYVRVLSGIQVRGQTERIDDNLDPVWNQVIYVPVHSKREDLVLEVMDYNENTKDKTLGITDLLLKDILQEIKTEDGQVVYEGTETVERVVGLTGHDRKKGRGTLKYTASFFPTLALAQENKKKTKEEAAVTEEEQEVTAQPIDLPEKDLHGEVIKYKTVGDKKQIDLTAYNSGVLSVKVHEVQLKESQKVTVNLLLDSNYPQFKTAEQKGSSLEVNETGTAFIKEIEFSKLIVNVAKVGDGEKDDKVIGRTILESRKILEDLLAAGDEPVVQELPLLDSNGGKIRLSFTYTPVIRFTLDPAESLENQGNLTVVVVKANNLVAADRNGTSDPFIRFYVDGERVFKTETYKKTLNPIFSKDETFTVPITNRITVPLIAKIYDWDQIGSDTLLGEAKITFTGEELETFVTATKEFPISQGGSLTLRLTWRPALVARKRSGTTLFSSTTRVITSAPVNALGAGGKVLGAGGKALGSGVSAIGSGIRGIGKIGKKTPTVIEESSAESAAPREIVTAVPAVESSAPVSSSGNASPTESIRRAEDGSGASVTVQLIEARKLKAMDRGGTSDPYVRVRIGSKVVYKTQWIKKTLTPEWNESFTAKLDSSNIIDFKVKDHNTINDVDIGDHIFNVNSLKPDQPFDGWLPLTPEGTGEIHVKIAFADNDAVSTKSGLFGKK